MQAQPTNNYTKDISPTNPNAASLGKYVDIPVSLYTGVPNISVPIYTIQEGPLSLPISLSYHASGVKVNELASSVGLNWSLNAGGVISRTVLGLPDDEATKGYLFQSTTQFNRAGNSLGPMRDLPISVLDNVRQENLDTEADLFTFNFAGYSGKFILDASKKFQIIPKQDLIIKVNGLETYDVLATDKKIKNFTIITPDGTQYLFDNVESSKFGGNFFNITFNLTKIQSHDSKYSITLNYDETANRYDLRNLATAQKLFKTSHSQSPITNQIGSVCFIANCDDNFAQKTDEGYYTTIRRVEEKALKSITTGSGTSQVDFILSPATTFKRTPTNADPCTLFCTDIIGGRQDVEYLLPDQSFGGDEVCRSQYKARFLQAIKIQSGTFCQSHVLNYDYFRDSSTTKNYGKRLRLENVQMYSTCTEAQLVPSSSAFIGSYKFNYEGDVITNGSLTQRANLVHRLSKAVDHWGFYNGAVGNENNTTNDVNIPPTTIGNFTSGVANRESDVTANALYMKQGTLNQITYPTGGYTKFEYEANKAKISDKDVFAFVECDEQNITNQKMIGFSTNDLPGGLKGLIKIKKYITTTTPVFVTAKILKASDNSEVWSSGQFTTTQSGEVQFQTNDINVLVANTLYKVTLQSTDLAPYFSSFTLYKAKTVETKTVGGLRVKKVTFKTSDTDPSPIVKDYTYVDDDGSSSGVLLTGIPTYGFFNTLNGVTIANNITTNFPFTPEVIMQSIGNAPSGNYDGYHVSYKKVTVTTNGAGKAVYTYTIEPEPTDKSYPSLPYQYRKESGQLSKEENFKQLPNASYVSLSSTENTSRTESYDVASNAYSFKVTVLKGSIPSTIWPTPPSTCSSANPNNPNFSPVVLGIMYHKYKVRTSVYRLQEVKETLDGITTTKTYDYYANPIQFPKTTTVVNSDGKIIVTTNKYVQQFAGGEYAIGTSGTPLIKSTVKQFLQANNIIGTPIETTTSESGIVISGQRTVFEFAASTGGISTANTTVVYPFKFYGYEPLTGKVDITNSNWQLKGEFTEYEMAANKGGKPTKYNAKGWITDNYTWGLGGVITKRRINGAANYLEWNYAYHPNTKLISTITDENGLIKTFSYDPLMRLSTANDRVESNGTVPPQVSVLNTYNLKTGVTNPILENYVISETTVANSTAPNNTFNTLQFFDGLGRPFMTCKENFTANANQKNYITYDAVGRQDRVYQPIANADYVDANKTRSIAPIGYYDAASLFKTTVWDENGNGTHTERGRTDTYKDKLDRVILVRKYVKDANDVYQKIDTYSVYDEFGDIAMVIPPGALTASTGANAILKPLVFEYQYDNQHRLSKKKVPNAEEVYYFYNSRDLVALTQDGNMRAAGKYLATVYDDLGRVVKTGFVTSDDPNNITISDAVNDPNRMTSTIYYSNSSWVQHQEAKVLKYDDPSTAEQEVPTLRNHIWSYIERRPGLTFTGNPAWTGKQHLLSKTFRDGWNEIADDSPITDNDYGGTDWSVSGYDGLQKPTLSIRYLYSGDNWGWQKSQEVRQSQTFTYDRWQKLTQSNYMYGLQGDVISATPAFVLSNMDYDDKKGLLKTKRTAQVDGKFLQSTNFGYNDRNWLTSINSGFANSSLDYPLFKSTDATASTYYLDLVNGVRRTPAANSGEDNPDLFKEIIHYGDPIMDMHSSITNDDKQYNGNISQIEYQVAGYEAQGYSFKYDNLDRMIAANYSDIHSTGWASRGWGTSQYSDDTKFQENVTYDFRGNIKSLTRKGTWANPDLFPVDPNNPNNPRLMYGNFGAIDNLSYKYDPNNANKLSMVTDNAPYGGDRGFKVGIHNSNDPNSNYPDYLYDDNGNITQDRDKDITNIQYNYLNLPTKITFGNYNIIYFVYDATGQKHQKITINNEYWWDPEITTYTYVNGIEYKNGVLQRFAHTEGAVTLQADNTSYAHEFVIKDHLGNTRVTYRDDSTAASPLGTIKVEEIVQTNHFYPFGLNMEGNWNGSFPEAKNKYQYGGKELNSDFGLDWNDFGARFYDPAIARWTAADPFSEKYFLLNPYNYTANNPIKFIDPNGKEIVVPNVADRDRVKEWINSRAQGTFDFDKDGKLYQVAAHNEKGYSQYYRDQLNDAIADKETTINIKIGDFIIPEGYDEAGQKGDYLGEGGRTYSAKDENGKISNKLQSVFMEGISVDILEDTKGRRLRDEAADILFHELVGHAIPRTKGKAYEGNAIDNENKVRVQLINRQDLKGRNGEPSDQLRKIKKNSSDEIHSY